MADEPDDTAFTPSMDRLLFKRRSQSTDAPSETSQAEASPVIVPPSPLEDRLPPVRTPTVKLEDAPAPKVLPSPAPVKPAPLIAKPVEEAVSPSVLDKPAKSITMPATDVRITAGNERRGPLAVKLFVTSLVLMLACFALAGMLLFEFYEKNVEPRFARGGYLPPQFDPTAQAEALKAEASKVETLKAELGNAQTALSKANETIAQLQQQQQALLAGQKDTTEGLAKLATQIKQQKMAAANDKPADSTASLSAALQVASVVPVKSEAAEELWLLKERNRLTIYADRAIAQGSSEAMENLWLSLSDNDLARLRDGVQVEIIRVQNYYARLSRLPPDYRLPVAELFHDDAIHGEGDLKPEQITTLLLDQKQPLEARIRCAFLLAGKKSDAVAQALVQAMKNDPVLDVVKEAQRTLERDYEMLVPPLNSRAAVKWWEQRSSKEEK